jgi:hypothetical protein
MDEKKLLKELRQMRNLLILIAIKVGRDGDGSRRDHRDRVQQRQRLVRAEG